MAILFIDIVIFITIEANMYSYSMLQDPGLEVRL